MENNITLTTNPEITIILGTYNRLPYLKSTIKNIRNHSINVHYEIIVIDGGSTDGTSQWLFKQKDIITIIQHNRGMLPDGSSIKRKSWGYFMNLGFKCAKGKYALMLSDDCLLVPNSVNNAYGELDLKNKLGQKVGGMAFYWRDWPGDDKYWVTQLFDKKITMVNHGFFNLEAVKKVGWFDEENFMFYAADGDLACRLYKAGFPIDICENAYVEHKSDVNTQIRSTNAKYVNEDFKFFYSRWKDDLYCENGSKGSRKTKVFVDKFETVRYFPKDPQKKIISTYISRIKDFLSM